MLLTVPNHPDRLPLHDALVLARRILHEDWLTVEHDARVSAPTQRRRALAALSGHPYQEVRAYVYACVQPHRYGLLKSLLTWELTRAAYSDVSHCTMYIAYALRQMPIQEAHAYSFGDIASSPSALSVFHGTTQTHTGGAFMYIKDTKTPLNTRQAVATLRHPGRAGVYPRQVPLGALKYTARASWAKRLVKPLLAWVDAIERRLLPS